jgi:peptide methionine sulfoxide reductase msrA/msrB
MLGDTTVIAKGARSVTNHATSTTTTLGWIAGVIILAGAITFFVMQAQARPGTPQAGAKHKPTADYSKSGYKLTPLPKPEMEQRTQGLSADERDVILNKGTERAFTGKLLENKREGAYVCRLCGLPLYSSKTKFKSGTGWPSFFDEFDPDHVRELSDDSHGMRRTEIVCGRCSGHLGHVFDDGPRPTGLRHCVNSASLRFVAADDKTPKASQPVTMNTAYFAGGCFWGIEDRLQQVPGVVDAVSGYQGGTMPDPNYKAVCTGSTGHAESVRVRFDPAVVSYDKLLEWFFKFHDPTQMNRQGPDHGTQYRSAIFTDNDAQYAAAQKYIAMLGQTPKFAGRKIVTEVTPAGPFFEAEQYHQDYHARHGGSCAIGGE